MGSRFFRHGELALVVLALLERQPMHGYQLIAELEALFGDDYEPSTGTVYPAVRALADEGLVASSEQGRRAVYSLTAVGRRALDKRSEQLASLELRTGVRIRDAAELDRLLVRARDAAKHVEPEKALVVLTRRGGGAGVDGIPRMTVEESDPFDRALAREAELRAQDEADEAIARQSARSSDGRPSCARAAALPVHLLGCRATGRGRWLTALRRARLLLCAHRRAHRVGTSDRGEPSLTYDDDAFDV